LATVYRLQRLCTVILDVTVLANEEYKRYYSYN